MIGLHATQTVDGCCFTPSLDVCRVPLTFIRPAARDTLQPECYPRGLNLCTGNESRNGK